MLVPSHHRPSHSGELVGERDGGDLGRTPRQQCGKPGPMLCAMDLGIADDGERTGGEQAAQIAFALFADAAELVLAPARVLLRHEPDPGREGRPSDRRHLRPGRWPAPANAGNGVQPTTRLIGACQARIRRSNSKICPVDWRINWKRSAPRVGNYFGLWRRGCLLGGLK